jgi:site-specific DNA-methyltransferase (adenine-specific)|tara:strand:+ start:790 stop:1572 length:783 start_codon:yes stop_codon:yes gene_type:complete
MTTPVHIGNATLYLGDCLEILPALEAGSVEMIWTDPPYGHGNHNGDWNGRLNEVRGIESQPIVNDDSNSMRRVVGGMFDEAARILRPDCCCCCCCCGGGPRPTFAWVADRMDRKGLEFFHSIIWDKKNPGLGWRYRRQHEMVMVAHRQGGKLIWADNSVTARNVYRLMPPKQRLHPNEKPLAMVEHFIELHTIGGQTVCDPFMGSGTTGVACARIGRKFIGIEIEPKYFDIACERIQKAYDQPDLFIEPPEKPVQLEMGK